MIILFVCFPLEAVENARKICNITSVKIWNKNKILIDAIII